MIFTARTALTLLLSIWLLAGCQRSKADPGPEETRGSVLQEYRAEDQKGDDVEAPAYSRLYDELLALEEQGDLVEALRIVPRIYGCEIPVDAFYGMLEAKRMEILGRLIEEGSLEVGSERLTVSDLRLYYAAVLSAPEILNFRYAPPGDLSFIRFLNLIAVSVSPQADLQNEDRPLFVSRDEVGEALASDDPWLVSAALFMERKGGASIDVDDLAARWKRRKDLWDEVCTDQALFLLASLSQDIVKGFAADDEDIRSRVKRLDIPSPDECPVQVVCFWKMGAGLTENEFFAPGSGLRLKRLERNEDIKIRRYAGDDPSRYNYETVSVTTIAPEQIVDGVLRLEPGMYSFQYVEGGGSEGMGGSVYGNSAVFSCSAGRFVRVLIPVLAGV